MEKVIMLIQRGVMDRTPVCVYPWEQPILEEIHGTNALQITLDELCDLKGGTVKIQKPKIREINGKKVTCDPSPSLREQYTELLKIDPEKSPLRDPEGEFARLVEKYGMHMQINLPNVEKVFGSPLGFRTALREYAAGRNPMAAIDDGPIETGSIDEEKPVAEMSNAEIREALAARKIKFAKNASRETLEELYTEAVAA